VDDNDSCRQQLARLLASWRLRPTTVSSAKAAITVLEETVSPHLAFAFSVIDAQMPDIDGFELAATIRRGLSERAGSLLILLSSPDRTAELARCERLGLAATIAKPVNESELLDTLMSLRLGAGGTEVPILPERLAPTARTSLRVLLAE